MSWNDNRASSFNKRMREPRTIDFSEEIKKTKSCAAEKTIVRDGPTPSHSYDNPEGEGPICEENTNECDEKSMRFHEENGNGAKSVERKIDITINDKAELRKALIERCEMIVINVIEQLCAGILPSISYKMTNIKTLMDQIGLNGSAPDEFQESSMSFDNSPLDDSENLESLGYESLGPETDDDESIGEFPEPRTTVKFSSRQSQAKFALMMTTMAKVHQLLINNETQTRRSFFYELKNGEGTSTLATDQRQIDGIVNNLANLLECGPSDIGLIGTAKGFGAGDLTLTLASGKKIHYETPGGVSIPHIVSNVTSVRTRAERVIVVEKDTVFQKLLEENCCRLLNCILITGKGYPDIPTRMLVNILAEKLQLPVYILVDADPHGMEIMFTYKYGSMNLSYEQGNPLSCASARWIGVHPSEFDYLKIPIITLTDKEITKLEAIKSRPYVTNEFLKELTIMRQGKADIEAIKRGPHEYELTTFYLTRKIQNSNYIE